MLDELKRRLDITWDDEDTNAKLNDILEEAKLQLDKFAGCIIDYELHPDIKGLLFDLCRYKRSNAYDEFLKNYSSELIMLRANFEVENINEEENISNI